MWQKTIEIYLFVLYSNGDNFVLEAYLNHAALCRSDVQELEQTKPSTSKKVAEEKTKEKKNKNNSSTTIEGKDSHESLPSQNEATESVDAATLTQKNNNANEKNISAISKCKALFKSLQIGKDDAKVLKFSRVKSGGTALQILF